MKILKTLVALVLMVISTQAMTLGVVKYKYVINPVAAEALFKKYKKVPFKNRMAILTSILNHSVARDINPNTALAIAIAESSLNPKAVGKGKYSQGLMQVNIRFHKEKFKRSPFNMNENVRVGVDILKTCQKRAKGNLERTVYCYRGLKSKSYYNEVVKHKQYGVFKLKELK